MYTASQKSFRVRADNEIIDSIRRTAEIYGKNITHVFLADGDALVLSNKKLLPILELIRDQMPAVRRISSYCRPGNLKNKDQSEVNELAAAGLSMVYVGAESGDNQVLAAVKKGETFDSTQEALDKLGTAGITRSVMILNGLGGKVWSEQHAVNSAKLANLTQPEFLATLVVSFPNGEQRFRADFPTWEALSPHELFIEMELFVSRLELKRTVFRSDHASNWLILKGTLGADKERLLAVVRQAIHDPQGSHLRPAWARGL
jgi:radical SAM superfamily enzyme YgiQ (UPF0313 family)